MKCEGALGRHEGSFSIGNPPSQGVREDDKALSARRDINDSASPKMEDEGALWGRGKRELSHGCSKSNKDAKLDLYYSL